MEFRIVDVVNFRNVLINAINEEGKYVVDELDVVKANDVIHHGITFGDFGGDVKAVYYVDDSYQRYLDGESFTDILQDLISFVERQQDAPSIKDSVKGLTDFNAVKDKIVYKVLNFEWNKEYLRDKLYIRRNNLAMVFAIDMGMIDDAVAHVVVSQGIAHMWEVDTKELYKLASINTPRIYPMQFRSMFEVLTGMMPDIDGAEEMFGVGDDSEMFILSNEQGINGAAVMFYPGVLKAIAEELCADQLVILPSSIHEVIIMRYTEDMSPRELRNMVAGVNSETVAKSEQLADTPYLYDSRVGVFNVF